MAVLKEELKVLKEELVVAKSFIEKSIGECPKCSGFDVLAGLEKSLNVELVLEESIELKRKTEEELLK